MNPVETAVDCGSVCRPANLSRRRDFRECFEGGGFCVYQPRKDEPVHCVDSGDAPPGC